jgi:hypothetical protein
MTAGPDIVAGPFWYEGPGFTNRHEFYPAAVFSHAARADRFDVSVYVWDFNGDGLVGHPRARPSPFAFRLLV